MSDASTLGAMSPGLLKVVERARREPEGRFHSLAHLIDVPALRRAYDRMRKDAAVGVDGMTKERYGRDLELRLGDLHDRLRSKRYRHQPCCPAPDRWWTRTGCPSTTRWARRASR